MAKKHKHEEHVNHERWLVSYADFITLLFATFTALFAISNRDMEKFKKLAASIKDAFSEGQKSLVEMPSVTQNGGSDPNSALVINIIPAAPPPPDETDKGKKGDDHAGQMFDGTENIKAPKPGDDSPDHAALALASPTPISTPAATPTPGPGNAEDGSANTNTAAGGEGSVPTPTPTPTPSPTPTPTPQPGSPAAPEGSGDQQLAQELQQLVNDNGLKGKVNVRQENRGMVISLGEAAFFQLGSADVQPASTHQLDTIVNALRGKDYDIRVEGHTDNTPIRSGRFKSNLELSTLRAARITEFMINEYHFAPDHLSSAGYGEFRPIAENTTDAGRQKNRRVDIVILNRRTAQAEPASALHTAAAPPAAETGPAATNHGETAAASPTHAAGPVPHTEAPAPVPEQAPQPGHATAAHAALPAIASAE